MASGTVGETSATHMAVKTRFCPSPTGLMHMGNARTALFNALWAWRHGDQGAFLLRIEDTDVQRSCSQYVDSLQEDLRWLGLVWQEGPGAHGKDQGKQGPYYQSKRQSIYDRFYNKLMEDGRAYPCFCTQTQLSLSRKQQLRQGIAPRYMGGCDALSAAQKEEKYAQGLKPVLRFRIPAAITNDTHAQTQTATVVCFEDGVKKAQRFSLADLGDFVIRRADGTAPFLFCNAIDDALMGVSCVMRGEDHLTNTPRQLLILSALSLPLPQYVHMGLILGHDGAPLSKRNGSQSIAALKQQGYLPLAVTNYLARVGHVIREEGETRLLSLPALAQAFSMASLSPSPSKFDKNQLQYWQKHAVMALSVDQMWSWIASAAEKWVPAAQQATFSRIIQENVLFPCEAAHWAKIVYEEAAMDYAASSQAHAVLLRAGVAYFDAALAVLRAHAGQDYARWSIALRQQLGLSGKAFFAPLRVALSGQLQGPQLDALCGLLDNNGVGGVSARLQQARDYVSCAKNKAVVAR